MFPWPPDIKGLETLVVVSEEGSFSRAAHRLQITQQGVSGQIKKLEDAVGKRLIDRTTHSMKLTKSGEALVLYARDVLRILATARRHLEVGGVDGTIRLGMLEAIATTALPFVLQRLSTYDKRIQIVIQTAETYTLLKRLEAGALDVMFGAQRVGDRHGEVLLHDPLRWVGDVSGLDDPTRPVPLVLPTEASPLRSIALDALVRGNRTWTVLFESDSRSSLQAAVAAGVGVSAFSTFMTGAPNEPTALPPPCLPPLDDTEVFMQVRRGSGRFAQAFADSVRTVMPEVSRLRAIVAGN